MTKIFMVEDDSLILRIYEKIFKANGFELIIAKDGEDAISMLKNPENKPGVILLDIMMPKKNGFDVLQEIKQNSQLKDIPVIILTNLYGDAEERKGLDMGAVTYLTKSKYVPSEIVDKVKEVVAKYSVK